MLQRLQDISLSGLYIFPLNLCVRESRERLSEREGQRIEREREGVSSDTERESRVRRAGQGEREEREREIRAGE